MSSEITEEEGEVFKGDPRENEKFETKRPKPQTKQERQADCSNRVVIPVKDEKNLTSKLGNLIAAKAEKIVAKHSIVKQDLSEEMEAPVLKKVTAKIIELAKNSSLRKINALTVARAIRKQLHDNHEMADELSFDEFIKLLKPHLEKFQSSTIAAAADKAVLEEIFHLFDDDDSKTADSGEIANLLAILCGGSMQDKINAAFLLFDTNNSGTMNFEELTNLLASVFKLVARVLESDELGLKESREYLAQVDLVRLPIITAEKCFKDLNLPKVAEINY